MAITLTCSCGGQLAVAEDEAGRPCRCPSCGAVVHVPAMGIVEPARRHHHRVALATPAKPRPRWPWAFALILPLLGLAMFILVRNLGRHRESDAGNEQVRTEISGQQQN